MQTVRRILAFCVVAGVSLTVAGLLILWAEPPALIRVAANYTAKTVCSNVFLARRDPLEVLDSDVQAPGHPLLRLMRITVDRNLGIVRAGVLGFIGGGLAVARVNQGCAVMPDGRLDTGRAIPRPSPPDDAGPPGHDVIVTLPALADILATDTLAGPGMRAIVVDYKGRFVGERYGAGFAAETPQLGWSMTKSVTAGLIGLAVKDGRVALDQPAGLSGWGSKDVTVADLLSMTSGLTFNETYGAVSDVTRMLYLEPDMASFAGGKPLAHPHGTEWSYSSGSAVVLARIFQNAVGSGAIQYAKQRLFEPLGMQSAVMETDEKGTFVGSSYMYATPREWARYGQLLAQDGMWEDQEILPRGYVAMMASPVTQSDGKYGHGMVWRRLHDSADEGLPADTFWMTGHDGQFIAVIPSRQVVIVRMGLTPEREHYQPEPLVRAVLAALAAG